MSHSGRGMTVGEFVPCLWSVSVKGQRGGKLYQKQCECQNQRHAGHMDADIDGIVMVGAILLSISKCRTVLRRCQLTKHNCFSRSRDMVIVEEVVRWKVEGFTDS